VKVKRIALIGTMLATTAIGVATPAIAATQAPLSHDHDSDLGIDQSGEPCAVAATFGALSDVQCIDVGDRGF
jgi:hypothetical protein